MASFSWKDVTPLTPSGFSYEKGVWRLKDTDGCTAVLFYAPWCPYCKSVKGEWEKFGKEMKSVNGIKVAALDCDEHQEMVSSLREDMPSLVTSYPTMLIFKNGSPERRIGQSESQRRVLHFKKECFGLCLGKK